LNSKIQELSSQVYRLLSIDDAYTFVCYYDLTEMRMDYTLLCNGIEVKTLQGIPIPVFLSYSRLLKSVEHWQDGTVTEFPIAVVLHEEVCDDKENEFSLDEAELR